MGGHPTSGEAHFAGEDSAMVDAGDEGDVDIESLALAFGDDIHGWSTAREAGRSPRRAGRDCRRCPQPGQDTNG